VSAVTRSHDYQEVLATSQRVNWRLEDLIGGENRLNFSQPFLPETLARTRPLEFLSGKERLLLNQIRARGYLGLFELVEAFIVPFVSGLAHGAQRATCFAPQRWRILSARKKSIASCSRLF
jgi:hypothetical protein